MNLETLTPTAPTLDPTTGEFSGRQQPSNVPDAVSGGVAGQFLAPLFQGSGSFDLLLTDVTLGDARNGVPNVLHLPRHLQWRHGGLHRLGGGPADHRRRGHGFDATVPGHPRQRDAGRRCWV